MADDPIIMLIVEMGGLDFPTHTYLESFDHEAHSGRGEAVFTNDKHKAMRFNGIVEAFEFWRKVPECKPIREDGKPNRPLTATTVSFERLKNA